jgi:hypothetical protein
MHFEVNKKLQKQLSQQMEDEMFSDNKAVEEEAIGMTFIEVLPLCTPRSVHWYFVCFWHNSSDPFPAVILYYMKVEFNANFFETVPASRRQKD